MDVVMKKKRTTEEEATVDNVVVVGDKEMKSGSEGAEVGEGGERQQGAEGGERQQSQSMEFHRKVLEKRLGEQGYVISSSYFWPSILPPFLSTIGWFVSAKKRRKKKLTTYL